MQNFKKIAGSLNYFIRGRGIGRMELASKLRLTQLELSAYDARQVKLAAVTSFSGLNVGSSGTFEPPVPTRLRYERARNLAYAGCAGRGQIATRTRPGTSPPPILIMTLCHSLRLSPPRRTLLRSRMLL